MSFMLEIDAARPAPLDQLVTDYLRLPTGASIEFCRRALGVDAPDLEVARRLGVAISTVRGWREIARRLA